MDVLFLSAQLPLHPMVDNQITVTSHKCTIHQKVDSTILQPFQIAYGAAQNQ